MTDLSLKAATPASPATDAEPSLHRVMGPWLLLLFIVGDILGTGIYALTGQVANQVGGARQRLGRDGSRFHPAPHALSTSQIDHHRK